MHRRHLALLGSRTGETRASVGTALSNRHIRGMIWHRSLCGSGCRSGPSVNRCAGQDAAPSPLPQNLLATFLLSVWNTSMSDIGNPPHGGERRLHQVGIAPIADRVPDDLAVAQIHQQADVAPLPLGPHVGRVAHDVGVRRVAVEASVEQVGQRGFVRLRARGPVFLPRVRAEQVVLPYDVRDAPVSSSTWPWERLVSCTAPIPGGAGVGRYHRHFRANTSAACFKTSTSIWGRLFSRRSVELHRSYSSHISEAGLPLSYICTVCRLNSSENFLGCLGSAVPGPFSRCSSVPH